jgi:eukaryotic-like serine/threonine-protein kinase
MGVEGRTREDLNATREGAAVDLEATRDGPEPVKVTALSAVNLGATRDAPQVSFGGSRGPVTRGHGLAGSEPAATTDSLPHSSGEAAEVPERLGRYLVIQQLGAGGMGVVYKAYDPDLDRKVAVKLLRGQGTEHARGRLLREAQAMAKLSHPGVVPVFDVGTVEGQVFVAMDFIAGETLQAWMKPPKPWREVLELFVQAALGLAAAHAAGLIHRDFKPEAVLRAWLPL